LSVLVTRPQAQAENLAAYIVEYGGNPLIFSTLGIESVEPPEGWDAILADLQQSDIVVFISGNAVREVMPYWQTLRASTRVAAIGKATAALLDANGVTADWLPMGDFRSEGLLALPAFADLAGKKVTLFAGEGGRDYLETQLIERGAIVKKIAVYRRFRPDTDPDILQLFLERDDRKIIIVTSATSLENLIEMAKPVGEIKMLTLLVISERLRKIALTLGFTDVVVAHEASSEALITDLKNWYRCI
ncbi:MAG: uroporphyrinogen-III synthase, partial [Pseudomonadota bacterium]|nr:uroporphyrinogen-III synthase [Pseudomonadota bacterium]